MAAELSGKFFAFEGLDGSGKSTQIAMLAEALRNRGLDVLVTREPSDGPHGRKIRENFQNRAALNPEEELALFLADRRHHVAHVIKPALVAGRIVLTDRYFLSTAAYQGARGHDAEQIMRENESFAPIPDLILLLDIPVAEGLRRIRECRGEVPNDFEQEESLARVAAVFDSIRRPYIRRIAADRDPVLVHREVLDCVLGCLADSGKRP